MTALSFAFRPGKAVVSANLIQVKMHFVFTDNMTEYLDHFLHAVALLGVSLKSVSTRAGQKLPRCEC